MTDRYIVATDRDGMMLEKLATIEAAVESLVPLLTKLIALQEAQTKSPVIPVASYTQLYDPIEAGPPEGELVAERVAPTPARLVGWWGRRFAQRDES